MFKKKWFLSLVVLMFVLVVSACAPDREEAPNTNNDNQSTEQNNSENNDGANESGEASMPEKPDKLLVWINDEDIAEDVSLEIFEKYTNETGIEIEFERIALPDQIQELSLAGPTGDGPDLFFQPQDRLGDVVAQGLGLPFTYTDEELAGFSDAAIDAFTFEDEIYGAPVAIETYFAFYNKSIMETPPTTLEEVFELSKDLTNPSENEYGFLIPPEFYYLYSFINGYGGYVFGEEGGVYDPEDIGLNNEGAIEGLTKYQDFINEGLLPKTLTVDVLDGLFSEGKVGMVVSGPWNMPIYGEALGDDLATAPLPEINGKGAPSFVGVKSWLLSYYSENPEWAEHLAKFMTNDENSQLYFDVTGELPPREEILDQIDDPIYEGYSAQVEFGTPMPNIPEMSPVWDMDDAIELINNGEDVKESLDDVVQNIKDKIAISQ